MFRLKIALFSGLLFFTACRTGGLPPGYFQATVARNLTQLANDPYFQTCVFDPGYSIVHFPMQHRPKDTRGITEAKYESIVRSQFQLLHTLIDYNRNLGGQIAVFDEHVTYTDFYTPQYYSELAGGMRPTDSFSLGRTEPPLLLSERLRTAQALFGNGFPAYYEHLTPQQKEFLWTMGASLTLYLTGELSQVHKVITKDDQNYVEANLNNNFTEENLNNNLHLVLDYRNQALVREVNEFYRQGYNPRLVFIAYGKAHHFSNYFAGYPFQSGHDFCLNWESNSSNTLP